ncbi:amino acid ABC transporter permease [Pseudoclavibacter chungangensis]|uniref:Amino acid ABC transporter permease n=1 Tax=Pseudoclavibacter chungangensis TaxID=587635 RepID=A0A7J5BMW1_9MICO|nr:amino acid ABC transporter permease [Pseudoclavibacter chungangensis]KAB1653118.1 amino acid ABC transporter permease [Pseudoclavibacter chungangensis]NYJ66993.1 glutamate transport system permease protein [Pseudoclavibacter chungangensis]
MTTSVLYDVPGPKAIARNKLLGALTVVVIVALIGFIIYRLFVTGQFTAQKWEIFAYAIVWQQILAALWATLSAFLVAAVGALILGLVLAIARLSDHAWVAVPARVVIEILRAIPVLVFMMLLYYGVNSFRDATGFSMSPFWSVVIALILYNGSVLAEVLRAGVEALPRGQSEAAYAIGLRKSGVMSNILMPQAIRSMLPVIIAQLVVTLKDTALGSIITYNELLYLAKFLGGQGQLGRPIVPMTIVVGAIYIITCILLSWVATVVQNRISASPKVAGGAAAVGNAGGVTDTQLIGVQQSDVLELEEAERASALSVEESAGERAREGDDGDGPGAGPTLGKA